MPTSRLPLAIAATALFALGGCGGGSGSNTPSEPAPDISQSCPLPTATALAIDTQQARPILNKEDYVSAALRFAGTDGAALDARIRGRGNSTWDMPKKPYKLKLDNKAGLLGMPDGKDWALLANYADKTLLRNELSFCIARTMGLPYTPDARTTELTLNGQYDGVYQLTNKTYAIEDQVKADARQAGGAPQAGAAFNDAFVLEIDFALREDHWFHSASGMPYNFTSDTDEPQRARIEQWFNALETLIRDRADPGRLRKVAALVDLQSLADYYLVNELVANVDTYQSSTYVHRRRDGLLTFGPVWDFDQALGPTKHNRAPQGWLLRNRPYNWYFKELLGEPEFAALVEQRWKHLARHVPSYQRFFRESAAALDAAQQRNFVRWPILGEYVFTNVIALGTYRAEVDYLDTWLGQRAQWMDVNIAALGQETP
ncbi:CotH kinase family protein [Pulveribacter sp.]|uniref:CotH kinase family protein n=1 Tax=Pulveribacter sp. TaxID=2678893 RepID=UPI0028B145BE|nr:CotH kinase family protein [Pulveribacter sp.]